MRLKTNPRHELLLVGYGGVSMPFRIQFGKVTTRKSTAELDVSRHPPAHTAYTDLTATVEHSVDCALP